MKEVILEGEGRASGVEKANNNYILRRRIEGGTIKGQNKKKKNYTL